MSFELQQRNPVCVDHGCAGLCADGVYAGDAPTGERRVVVDLYILDYVRIPWIVHNRTAFPRLASIPFEVRPNALFSQMGASAWTSVASRYVPPTPRPAGWPMTLPAFVALRTGPGKGVRVALDSSCFGIPYVLPGFLLRPSPNPDACYLGQDFLRHGVLCWERKITYFFPGRLDPPGQSPQSAWARSW